MESVVRDGSLYDRRFSLERLIYGRDTIDYQTLAEVLFQNAMRKKDSFIDFAAEVPSEMTLCFSITEEVSLADCREFLRGIGEMAKGSFVPSVWKSAKENLCASSQAVIFDGSNETYWESNGNVMECCRFFDRRDSVIKPQQVSLVAGVYDFLYEMPDLSEEIAA